MIKEIKTNLMCQFFTSFDKLIPVLQVLFSTVDQQLSTNIFGWYVICLSNLYFVWCYLLNFWKLDRVVIFDIICQNPLCQFELATSSVYNISCTLIHNYLFTRYYYKQTNRMDFIHVLHRISHLTTLHRMLYYTHQIKTFE